MDRRSAKNPSFSLIPLLPGSAIQRCDVPRLIDRVGSLQASIFSRALASAIGFLVSSAPEASARYSLRLDTHIAISLDNIGARITEIIHMTKIIRPSAGPDNFCHMDYFRNSRPDIIKADSNVCIQA